MNSTLLLIISSSLIIIWVLAIVLTKSFQEQTRWQIPKWLESSLTLRIAPVLFYVLLVFTVSFNISIPLFSGRPGTLLATICMLPNVGLVFLFTYVGKFRAATQTKVGKTIFVTVFIVMTLVATLFGSLLFWLEMN